MKIISSYGVELRKQNIPIRQTLEIYRSAVRYLVETICSVDLGINTDAVCTIMRPDGTILVLLR